MTCKEEAPAAGATRGQMAATHAVESDGDALNRPGAPSCSNASATPRARPSDPILSAISGGAVASAVIRDAESGCAGLDALRDAIQAVVAANDPHLRRASPRWRVLAWQWASLEAKGSR